MIENYDNDEKMALYGRYCTAKRAIRKAKEGIRDVAVIVLNGNYNTDELNAYHAKMEELFSELKEAVTALATSSAPRQDMQSNQANDPMDFDSNIHF